MGAVTLMFLAASALEIGLIDQKIGGERRWYGWLITALAAFLGGVMGSELLGAASAWGPSIDGLYVLPAMLGELVVGALAAHGQRASRAPSV